MAVVRLPRAQRDSEIVAAVDAGASKAVCLIAHLATAADGGKIPEIIGVGLQGAPAPDRAGAGKGAGGEAAMRAAVDAAERMAGERVGRVHAAASGRSLHCRRIGVDLDVEGGRVTREDVADCLAQGAEAATPEGYRALHAVPISFAVDGDDAGLDPSGLAGALLSAEILGVGVRENKLFNLESLIERCGLRVASVVAAPFAAAEAVLLDDEKDLGVVLIDIGAGSTGYAVYERGALVACGGAPIGGEHITRDIAHVFGAPLAQAERAKTLYGAAAIGLAEEHALFDFRQLADEGDIRISRAELCAVISPRLEEIFDLTAKRLPADARARCGARRVVLTGGGSLLIGARVTAERVLGMRARLGRPSSIAGAPEAATAPQFSVCAGLIQLAAKQRARRGERARPSSASPRVAAGVLSSVGAWLRDNF